MDFTPAHAEFLCVMIRAVTKQWQLIEVFVSCCAYATSFNAIGLARAIQDMLEIRLKLTMAPWRVVMIDQCEVNYCCIKTLKPDDPCVSVEISEYMSHGICNAGKAIQAESAKYSAQYFTSIGKVPTMQGKTNIQGSIWRAGSERRYQPMVGRL